MLYNIKSLDTDKQVAFLLGLSETVVDILKTSPNYDSLTNALKVAWEWVTEKKHSGDDIYYLLDVGTDETGLFMQMQDEIEKKNELVFGCIVDAISFVCWKAYQNEDEEYLPGPIENVDEDIIQQFLEGYFQIDKNNKKNAEVLFDRVQKSKDLIKESIVI